MKKLINWTAKRAGGRITINGIDAGNMKPLKIVGVDMIEAGLTALTKDQTQIVGHPIATDMNGEQYILA